MAENALYYPYIHVRDVDWLKATLLLFKQVRRMVPVWEAVDGDDPLIQPFTQPHGGRAPLLEPADIWSDRAMRAQRRLARLLRESSAQPAFIRKYGRGAPSAHPRADPLGFRIHQRKLHESLREALAATGLAWQPEVRERWDPGAEYVQVHPKIGQAIMATLAVACAKGEGLEIVSDERSLKLHRCLLEQDEDAIFRSYLGRGAGPAEPLQTSGAELFQFFISFACDTRSLEVQELAAMGADREPLALLMRELDRRAERIDPMDPGARRLERLQDEALDILRTWSRDRANMSGFWKRFFGVGALDSATRPVEKITERALVRGTAEGFSSASILGASAGVAIGVVVRGVKALADTVGGARNSPYQYLSTLERRGVTFQYDKVLLNRRLHTQALPGRRSRSDQR